MLSTEIRNFWLEKIFIKKIFFSKLRKMKLDSDKLKESIKSILSRISKKSHLASVLRSMILGLLEKEGPENVISIKMERSLLSNSFDTFLGEHITRLSNKQESDLKQQKADNKKSKRRKLISINDTTI